MGFIACWSIIPKVSNRTIFPFRATIIFAPAIFSLSISACTEDLVWASFSEDIPRSSGEETGISPAKLRQERARKSTMTILVLWVVFVVKLLSYVKIPYKVLCPVLMFHFTHNTNNLTKIILNYQEIPLSKHLVENLQENKVLCDLPFFQYLLLYRPLTAI